MSQYFTRFILLFRPSEFLIISVVVHSTDVAVMALSSIIHSVQCATQFLPPLSISFTIQIHFLHHFRINLISFVTFSNLFWYTHHVREAFRQFARRTYVYRNDAVVFSFFLSYSFDRSFVLCEHKTIYKHMQFKIAIISWCAVFSPFKFTPGLLAAYRIAFHSCTFFQSCCAVLRTNIQRTCIRYIGWNHSAISLPFPLSLSLQLTLRFFIHVCTNCNCKSSKRFWLLWRINQVLNKWSSSSSSLR